VWMRVNCGFVLTAPHSPPRGQAKISQDKANRNGPAAATAEVVMKRRGVAAAVAIAKDARAGFLTSLTSTIAREGHADAGRAQEVGQS